MSGLRILAMACAVAAAATVAGAACGACGSRGSVSVRGQAEPGIALAGYGVVAGDPARATANRLAIQRAIDEHAGGNVQPRAAARRDLPRSRPPLHVAALRARAPPIWCCAAIRTARRRSSCKATRPAACGSGSRSSMARAGSRCATRIYQGEIANPSPTQQDHLIQVNAQRAITGDVEIDNIHFGPCIGDALRIAGSAPYYVERVRALRFRCRWTASSAGGRRARRRLAAAGLQRYRDQRLLHRRREELADRHGADRRGGDGSAPHPRRCGRQPARPDRARDLDRWLRGRRAARHAAHEQLAAQRLRARGAGQHHRHRVARARARDDRRHGARSDGGVRRSAPVRLSPQPGAHAVGRGHHPRRGRGPGAAGAHPARRGHTRRGCASPAACGSRASIRGRARHSSPRSRACSAWPSPGSGWRSPAPPSAATASSCARRRATSSGRRATRRPDRVSRAASSPAPCGPRPLAEHAIDELALVSVGRARRPLRRAVRRDAGRPDQRRRSSRASSCARCEGAWAAVNAAARQVSPMVRPMAGGGAIRGRRPGGHRWVIAALRVAVLADQDPAAARRVEPHQAVAREAGVARGQATSSAV